MSDAELKTAKLKEAVKNELSNKNEIVEIKRTNNYRCMLCCLFPFRNCMDSSVLPDARGGFIGAVNTKPIRRRSIPAAESDPATEELIRRVWHDQDEDEIQVDDSIKDESASEISSHDNISVVKDIDQLTHTCNNLEHDEDSIQVENIPEDLNLQEDSENDTYEEESNQVLTEGNSITTTVAIVTEYSEHDIEEEDTSNTSVVNSSNLTETSQEDSNTDVASSFDGSFDGNNTTASLNNSQDEGSTTTEDNSTTNSADIVSRASSDDDVIESSDDVTDAGLHRNVVRKESSTIDKETKSLPRKNKRSLISRLTKPSKSASKSGEIDELHKSSKKVLNRKGSFREKLQKKLFEEKAKKSSPSSKERTVTPTKLSPSRAVVSPKSVNKKSAFKSTKGIKKLGLFVGKQLLAASGAGKKEYKLVNAFSPPAVNASHFCVGLPMVRTPSVRRTVPHHAIGTVSNVLYMKRNQH